MVSAEQLAQAVLEGESPREFIKKLPRHHYMPVNTSVSHGTLNDRDLIEAFMDALREYNQSAYIEHYSDDEYQRYRNHEMSREEARDFEDTYVHEVLWSDMSDCCPPLTYFGASEGDLSDFGCWPYSRHDYADLAAEGRIAFAAEGDNATAQAIRSGNFYNLNTEGQADYGVIENGYYQYEVYEKGPRLIWST